MSCKKIINSAETAVNDAIEGLVLVNNHLTTICNGRVVIRRDVDELKQAGKVTIVSGGGSGHEPAWAGYVGPGMLTASVCGNVFASPPSSTVYETIVRCAQGNPAGTLVVVKNYTGDRVNFGLAIERAKAIGLKVEMVVAAEDCALTSSDRSAGRRGLCGAMLMDKVAGAMSDERRRLEEIVTVCESVNNSMGTIGVSLGPCSLPGSSTPLFSLASDEMELGLGIHGEAGVKKVKLMSAKDIVAEMFNHMTNPESASCLHVDSGDRVAVVINNLGGTSYLELSIVAKEILCLCAEKNIKVERVYCGTFVTSLEMPGISLTLLKVDDALIRYLDSPCKAPGWSAPWRSDNPPEFNDTHSEETKSSSSTLQNQAATISKETGELLKICITSACDALIAQEQTLNDLDIGCGDGDTGSTLTQGCKALLQHMSTISDSDLCKPALVFSHMSDLIEKHMGGTSGALYGLFFSAAAVRLVTDTSAEMMIEAFSSGVSAVMKYGKGQQGDRTMLDALIPALTELQKCELCMKERLKSCAQCTRRGADSTAGMKAKSGRASYTPREKQQRVDPGAEAVAVWISQVCQSVLNTL